MFFGPVNDNGLAFYQSASQAKQKKRTQYVGTYSLGSLEGKKENKNGRPSCEQILGT